jgi:hypothetical protein
MAITLADPGGPIETLKESSAALQTVLEAAQSGKYGDFVQGVARDFAEKARHRQNPMAASSRRAATRARRSSPSCATSTGC